MILYVREANKNRAWKKYQGEPRAQASGELRQCVFAKLSSNLFVQDHTFGFCREGGGRWPTATPRFDRIKAQIGDKRKSERYEQMRKHKNFNYQLP